MSELTDRSRPADERSRPTDAVVLSFAVLVALGLARFAYSLVLPAMRSDLGLSYGAAGSLGTANTAGYLVGLLCLPLVVARWPLVQVFKASVVVTALAVGATGIVHEYWWVLIGRALSGCAGAGAFILGSAIAASMSMRTDRSGRVDAVAVFNAGGGVGVMIAGLTLPALLHGHPDRWPGAWFLLGAIGVTAALAVRRVRWVPPSSTPARISLVSALTGRPSVHWLTGSYACFGAGYIVFVTFLVSTLRSSGATLALTTAAVASMGVMAVVGPILWRRAIASWPTNVLMAATLAAQGAGAAVLVVSRRPVAVMVSVVVFGSTFLLTPALVPMTIRRTRPASEWATTIGAVTVFFALAQAISPWICGVLIDHLGVAAGPVWTLTFSAIGAGIALAASPSR